MDLPPPVIDIDRQARIETIVNSTPSTAVYNIIALVVIGLAVFFLYKRYKDKQATSLAHDMMLRPSPIIQASEPAPVVEDSEVKEE